MADTKATRLYTIYAANKLVSMETLEETEDRQ
jgi:hypothetical protein